MSDVPQAVSSGTVTIMGVEMRFHMLDNGQRIIEADSAHRLFEAMASGSPLNEADAMQFAKILQGGK